MKPRALFPVLLILLAAPAGAAEPRSPQEMARLYDLAAVLGRSHALQQTCRGEGDGFWFDRMQRLLAVEAPDETARRRLVESFNTGFNAQRAETPVCPPDADAVRRRLSLRGAETASAFSGP